MKLLIELPLDNAPEGAIFSAAESPKRLSPFGDWSLVTWIHGIGWEWVVRADNGRKVLEHPTIFTSCLRAGDGSWGNFTLEFDVRQMYPLADTSMDEIHNVIGRVGVMFRYQAYRRSYALFLEEQKRVVLCCRNGQDWTPLAIRELEIDRARYYRFRVECKGDNIRCWMDDEPLFDVTDSTFRMGRFAIFANTLARFGFCRVTTDDDGEREIAGYINAERLATAKAAEGLAIPVLWKRIPHPAASTKKALHVTSDGKLRGAVMFTTDNRYAPRDGRALIKVDMDGNVVWSKEACPNPSPRIFGGPPPAVFDVDGDGREEVIWFDGPVARLLDAETGAVKIERPTPPCNERGNRSGREDEAPYAPVYKIYPANIRGLGKNRDIVIMDIHTGFWVLDDKLNLLYSQSREHGHDIGLYDIDGDGRDEIMAGHTLLDHDGREMWTLPDTEYMVFTHHHVDHVRIGEFDGDAGNGPEIAMTCGNLGFLLLDAQGNVRAHCREIGHAQSLNVGKFRPDLPGRQFLVGCLWGNPGSRTLFSGTGERLWTIEPDNSQAYDTPLRWAPDRDLFLLVSSISAAGLYDGYGRKLIPFPDAELSVSDRPFFAGDFTGNGLDDFVIETKDALLVYTQGTMISHRTTRL